MIKSGSFTAKNFGKGLDNTSGVENLSMESLSTALNVRFRKEGGVYTRLGYERRATLGTGLPVQGMGVHEGYGVLFCKSGTKIYQSIDGDTWYDIGATRTTGEKDFFYAFGKDMFVVNQTDGLLRISLSTLASSITPSSTSVGVKTGDGGGFTNGVAVIYIEGDSINYTAVSTNTLTTVTNIAANHAAGAIITQFTVLSSAPKGKCMSDLEGSLFIGGTSAFPSILYYSAPSTEARPEYAYDFSSNGAGSKRMSSDVNALHKAMGIVIIGMKKGIDYAYSFSADTNGLLTRTVSHVHSVPSSHCIGDMGDQFVIFTGKRILTVLSDGNGVRIPMNPSSTMDFDFPISNTLTETDDDQSLSFVHYNPTINQLSVTYFKDFLSNELVLNKDIGAWSIDEGKVYSCKVLFNGKTYGGSENLDYIFLDDSTQTDDGSTITHRIVSGVYVMDDRRITMDFLKHTHGALLSATGAYTLTFYVNGSSLLPQEITADLLQDAGLMNVDSGIPMGSGTVGAETLGGGAYTTEIYSYTYPLEFLLVGERFQWEIEIEDEGTAFELRDSRVDFETFSSLDSNSF